MLIYHFTLDMDRLNVLLFGEMKTLFENDETIVLIKKYQCGGFLICFVYLCMPTILHMHVSPSDPSALVIIHPRILSCSHHMGLVASLGYCNTRFIHFHSKACLKRTDVHFSQIAREIMSEGVLLVPKRNSSHSSVLSTHRTIKYFTIQQ